jgi:hypothetical protein
MRSARISVVPAAYKCAEVAWFPLLALHDSMPEYERFVLDCLASGQLAPFTSFGFSTAR